MALRQPVALLFVLGLAVTPRAVAAQSANGVAPEAFTQEVIFEAGEACQRPTSLVIEGTIKEINAGDKTIIIGPRARATVTNLSNPSNPVTLNIPGSFHVQEQPDRSVLYQVDGRNLLWGGTLPFLTLTVGTFTFTLDALGNEIEPLAGNGQIIDVCQMIE